MIGRDDDREQSHDLPDFVNPGIHRREVLYYFTAGDDSNRIVGLVCFAVAAILDGVDGYIARRYHQRSELGAILDPLADKLLLVSGILLLSLPASRACVTRHSPLAHGDHHQPRRGAIDRFRAAPSDLRQGDSPSAHARQNRDRAADDPGAVDSLEVER